jgi:hypothetical protein
MNQQRQQAEELIYKIYDTVDPSKTNSDYYRKIFATMSDQDFVKFCKRRLPFRFHNSVFKVEPKMYEIIDAFKVLNKPLLEKVKLPYLAKDENGNPIESKECLVGYLNIKRLKQMLTKKNNTAIEIDKRDMKTGRLLGTDKGGIESNKEFEGALALGLENTSAEFARIKAAAMKAKAEAYNTIRIKGEVSMSDIDTEKTDSIPKNTMNVYLIGAGIHTNLIDEGYYNPHYMERKRARIEREY